MQRRIDDPPDGQPPTCVGATEVGRFFWAHHHASAPEASADGNGHQPPRTVEQKCERCDRPGVRFFDQHWCCDPCGQAVLDRLSEELQKPAPRRIEKPITSGPRQRRKK